MENALDKELVAVLKKVCYFLYYFLYSQALDMEVYQEMMLKLLVHVRSK
jgi:DNA-directed RNA polymerase specialized sigma24 family protein